MTRPPDTWRPGMIVFGYLGSALLGIPGALGGMALGVLLGVWIDRRYPQ